MECKPLRLGLLVLEKMNAEPLFQEVFSAKEKTGMHQRREAKGEELRGN